MFSGALNPKIRWAFTVAPEVVYLPMVLLKKFATNRFWSETAMPRGPLKPEIRGTFTGVPEKVYRLIVPREVRSYRCS